LNAVVEVTVEAVLGQAAAADEAVAGGRDLGPWHGVPMTVKDSFYVEGMPHDVGQPAFKDHVADRDATVVQRLRDAGAVIVRKTNVHFTLAFLDRAGIAGRPAGGERANRGHSRGSAGGAQIIGPPPLHPPLPAP
jgi:amidase